jgi:hypothetical protein
MPDESEMRNDEIRDILLKMYELQKKQYTEYLATTSLYRQRQRLALVAAGCLVAILIAFLGITTIIIFVSR